jgi:pimeloyl-ACP methyl ester carboxylesterase
MTIPTITLDGTQDPLKPCGTADHAKMVRARHEHRVVACGHNLPWEAPQEFADAVTTVRVWAVEGDKYRSASAV